MAWRIGVLRETVFEMSPRCLYGIHERTAIVVETLAMWLGKSQETDLADAQDM